jgi:hypothetical protein
MAAYTQIPQPTQPCCAARPGDSPCWLALQPAGGAAFGPWPPAFWPAPYGGEARRYGGQPDVAGRGRRAAGFPAFLQENIVFST